MWLFQVFLMLAIPSQPFPLPSPPILSCIIPPSCNLYFSTATPLRY